MEKKAYLSAIPNNDFSSTDTLGEQFILTRPRLAKGFEAAHKSHASHASHTSHASHHSSHHR
jgi:hypothetical protein